jgi:drug/metabolite transporter (DMT)-like permease
MAKNINSSNKVTLDSPDRGRPSIRFIFLIIALHQIIASFAYPISKIGLNQIDPYSFAFFRFVFSSAFYVISLAFIKYDIKIGRGDHLRIFVLGLVIILMNQFLFLVGQSMTTASHGSLLFATMPIFIYLLAVIFLREKATLRRSLGILVAMVGVYIVLAGGRIQFGTGHLLGDFIVLGAVIALAVGTIIGKPLAQKYGAFRVTALALIYGSAVYFPFGLFWAFESNYSGVGLSGWLSIVYMAIVMSVIGYVSWFWIMRHMEASRVAVVQNIQPIIASAVAAIVLSEPISSTLILGGSIVIIGVLINEAT